MMKIEMHGVVHHVHKGSTSIERTTKKRGKDQGNKEVDETGDRRSKGGRKGQSGGLHGSQMVSSVKEEMNKVACRSGG